MLFDADVLPDDFSHGCCFTFALVPSEAAGGWGGFFYTHLQFAAFPPPVGVQSLVPHQRQSSVKYCLATVRGCPCQVLFIH